MTKLSRRLRSSGKVSGRLASSKQALTRSRMALASSALFRKKQWSVTPGTLNVLVTAPTCSAYPAARRLMLGKFFQRALSPFNFTYPSEVHVLRTHAWRPCAPKSTGSGAATVRVLSSIDAFHGSMGDSRTHRHNKHIIVQSEHAILALDQIADLPHWLLIAARNCLVLHTTEAALTLLIHCISAAAGFRLAMDSQRPRRPVASAYKMPRQQDICVHPVPFCQVNQVRGEPSQQVLGCKERVQPVPGNILNVGPP